MERLNSVVFVAVLAFGGGWFVMEGEAGSVSTTENRELAPMPDLTVDNMVGGVFSDGVEAYVADHFPAREALMNGNFLLRQCLGYKGGDVVVYDVEVNEGGFDGEPDESGSKPAALNTVPAPAAVGGEAHDGPAEDDEPLAGEGPADEGEPLADDGLADEGEPLVDDGDGPGAPSAPVYLASSGTGGAGKVPENAQAVSGSQADARQAGAKDKATVSRGIMIYKGRAMQMFGGTARGSRGWADTVNAYRKALPDSVRVYGLIVPSAAEFYAPPPPRRRSKPEKPNIDASYGYLVDGVTRVDAVSELDRHRDEDIYFKTDHHWTGRGAWYAFVAFCRAAGITPVKLDSLKRGVIGGWLGSLYYYTRDNSLRQSKETVEYWDPGVQYTATVATSLADPGKPWKLLKDKAVGYGVFLGGDKPLISVRTSVRNGRRVLLLKNSYGNPFGVFLATAFEEVYVVDYRYFRDSIVKLVDQKGITDVVILNGSFSANTPSHYKRVGQLLKGLPPPRRTASEGQAR